ncbi:MAG: Lar family restriction alleviation protein [Synergistaceae bacterium]|nr:Lar family restriction alleviation protein [Synergistaceae bacterium]
MTGKLKPCPYCGSTQVDFFASFGDKDTNQNYMNIECLSCGAQGPTKLGEEQAIKAWNNRAAGQLSINNEFFKLVSDYVNSENCIYCPKIKAALSEILKLYKQK